jgi:hypothetical protein
MPHRQTAGEQHGVSHHCEETQRVVAVFHSSPPQAWWCPMPRPRRTHRVQRPTRQRSSLVCVASRRGSTSHGRRGSPLRGRLGSISADASSVGTPLSPPSLPVVWRRPPLPILLTAESRCFLSHILFASSVERHCRVNNSASDQSSVCFFNQRDVLQEIHRCFL